MTYYAAENGSTLSHHYQVKETLYREKTEPCTRAAIFHTTNSSVAHL